MATLSNCHHQNQSHQRPALPFWLINMPSCFLMFHRPESGRRSDSCSFWGWKTPKTNKFIQKMANRSTCSCIHVCKSCFNNSETITITGVRGEELVVWVVIFELIWNAKGFLANQIIWSWKERDPMIQRFGSQPFLTHGITEPETPSVKTHSPVAEWQGEVAAPATSSRFTPSKTKEFFT